MNKNIRRIIALTLVISAYGAISPTTSEGYFNIGSKAVYASSYSPSDDELKSLSVKSTNGDTLDLRDDYNGSTVKLNDDKNYYVKLTDDSDGIKINATAEGSESIVRIFTSDRSDETGLNSGDKIQLGKGNTTIYVRTYESLSAYRKAKDKDKDVRLCKEEYKINAKKTTGSSYEDETQDEIYLSKLELNKGSITFLKQRTSYDVKVDSSVSEIKITAQPEESGDRVRINGSLIDESDSYRKTIDLDKGKNEIKVKITDSKDNQRTYTLNITRGSASDNQDDIYLREIKVSEGTIDFSKDKNSYEINLDEAINKIKIAAEPEDSEYLVTINDKEVKYKDDYEKEISLDKGTNTIKVLVEDEVKNIKRTYTLTVNRGKAGSSEAATTTSDDKKPGWVETTAGWKYNDTAGNPIKNSWLLDKDANIYCYLNEDGLRKTGWLKDKDNWYLLDSKGAMLTGWQEDGGKKYFLDSNGAMNRGWHKEEAINKDNTKIQNWYYLNSDGSMLTGWMGDGGKWYYLNKTGIMQTGWLIDSNSKYYLNESGVMVTGTKVIDGKTYKFTSGGALII